MSSPFRHLAPLVAALVPALLAPAAASAAVEAAAASSVSVGDTSVTEGGSGTSNAVFTVSLARARNATVEVDYATSDGSAVAGLDYTARTGKVVFAPGETTKAVAVPVSGDTLVEPNETFTLSLSNPTRATIADGSATGTIVNDDVTPSGGGGGSGTNDGSPLPGLDTSAPVLSQLSLTRTSFRVGRARTAVAARAGVGTTIRYRLTEAATVTFIFDGVSPGKTVKKKCVAPTKKNSSAKSCNRYTPMGTLTRRSKQGANRLLFSGRIGSQALKPGPYRLRLIATDGANNRSPIATKTFTVVKK